MKTNQIQGSTGPRLATRKIKALIHKGFAKLVAVPTSDGIRLGGQFHGTVSVFGSPFTASQFKSGVVSKHTLRKFNTKPIKLTGTVAAAV